MGESESSGEKTDNEFEAYCSICGSELSDPGFALNYPNFVCDECNSTAVNAAGNSPWHGWPPGEKPESESGSIQMAPDHGENPVFIDGIKCWRRYRFGGHIALRDTFDCESLEEFYDAHETEDGFFQVYNSPDPPGVDTDRDRLLVEYVDRDELQVHVWGLLSAETGEILARNSIAEQIFGPFEEFLARVEERTGGETEYEQTVTDPTRMLSLFNSFGSQAHKPKVLYLVPELDRPLSGHDAILETGVLRALRAHDVNNRVFELGVRAASKSNALTRESGDEGQTQMTLDDMEQTPDSGESSGSTVTVRYELPYRNSTSKWRHLGTEIAVRILQELVIATKDTDYTFLSALPAVDIHAYRAQGEVLTIGIDADTVRDTDWDGVSDQPQALRELSVTFTDAWS